MTVAAAVVYLEACLRELEGLPADDRHRGQSVLWVEHLDKDLKSLRLMAMSEETGGDP